MLQIGLRLVEIADGVILRCGAVSKPLNLRKDIPHPMTALAAALDLAQRCIIVARLTLQETIEIIFCHENALLKVFSCQFL